MDEKEYDERLLMCQECGGDFLYTIDDQLRDDREEREPPRKCPRCKSGKKPQPEKQQAGRGRGYHDQGGRGPRSRQMYAEEYRSPSFQQDASTEYRGPAFGDTDPARHRARSQGGSRQPARNASRQRFQIVCSSCGRQDTIPFKPSPNRPVYCHECYETHRFEEKKGRGSGKNRSQGRG
jgi:CxxC-x17-CxxC domain-containing protein